MAKPSAPLASRHGSESWPKLLLSLSLAAMITSGAGLLGEFVRSAQQSCSLSGEILGDESPNPALTAQDQRSIAAQAKSRLLECLGGGR
jgi:hypothetical protein